MEEDGGGQRGTAAAAATAVDAPTALTSRFVSHIRRLLASAILRWLLWFDDPDLKRKRDQDWGASLKPVYGFDTVKDYWWRAKWELVGWGGGWGLAPGRVRAA